MSGQKFSDKIVQGVISEAKDIILQQMRDLLQEKAEKVILDEPEEMKEELEVIEEESDEEIDEEEKEDKALKESYRKSVANLSFVMTESFDEDPERDVVIDLIARGRSLGGDDGIYSEGLLFIELNHKRSAADFADYLEEHKDVVGYEIQILFKDVVAGYDEDGEYDLDTITDDKNFTYGFYIYLNPEIVQYQPYEMDVEDGETIEDANGMVNEVVRKIKINFRGKKRVKMKCARGFKWNGEKRTCEKIGGSDLAKMRKSLRRAVLTKRSKGASYKARIVRKSRKAKRFRKMMGL